MGPSGKGDYRRIEQAIRFLEEHVEERPGLREISRHVQLSEYHFQRLFRRWAGITPKQFLQVVNLERTKALLRERGSLLDVAGRAGMSSPSRLHDLFVSVEAVTPRQFREGGRDLSIRYGFHPTPFGECLIAVTDRGITNLAFVAGRSRAEALQELRRQWKHARLSGDPSGTAGYAERVFGKVRRKGARLDLALRGTNFQIKVWQALLRIPRGSVASYEEIAERIGRPSAVRAVANAVARNPVAFLVPCHRVIRKTGALGGYHWGTDRKKAMLAWESAAELAPRDPTRVSAPGTGRRQLRAKCGIRSCR